MGNYSWVLNGPLILCQVHLLPSANRPPHDGFFNVPNLRLLQLWTRMCRNERLGFNDCQTTTSQAGTTSYPENKTRLSEEKLKGRARGSRGQATRACRKFPYPHKRQAEEAAEFTQEWRLRSTSKKAQKGKEET